MIFSKNIRKISDHNHTENASADDKNFFEQLTGFNKHLSVSIISSDFKMQNFVVLNWMNKSVYPYILVYKYHEILKADYIAPDLINVE